LENGGEAQAGNGANDRSVKRASGQSEADESNINHDNQVIACS
jgi:hypothetical protein